MKIRRSGKNSLFIFLALNFIFTGTFFFENVFAASKNFHQKNSPGNFTKQQSFIRSELYFGMNKPDGLVTEDEWSAFLTEVVTARFPSGFTILSGSGQYRDSNKKIVRENSRVLILFYPSRNRRDVSRKIEQIRRIYKQKFQQESVLRMDFQQPVRVSF